MAAALAKPSEDAKDGAGSDTATTGSSNPDAAAETERIKAYPTDAMAADETYDVPAVRSILAAGRVEFAQAHLRG